MTEALAPIAPAPPPVTAEQLDLIRKTIANGATDTELKLFLYDCERRGVHPLDKLLHFTKRQGRYTPIVSIDFLRTRAAQTGEMAGSDDAVFTEGRQLPTSATVTVYRLTRGQRFAYAATARFDEYCPPQGQDHMWRKMPHTMLGKCAEALALRKAFPAQLAGLYVGEELEQARPDFTTTATAIADQYTAPTDPEPEDARDAPEVHGFSAARLARLPSGAVFITHVAQTLTKNPNVTRYTLTVTGPNWPANQTTITTINEHLAAVAEGAWHTEQAVVVKTTKNKFGYELAAIEYARERPAVETPPTPAAVPAPADGPPLTGDDIPF